MKVVGTIRGRGRKPDGTCITRLFTEGDVKLRRSIFRKLKALIQDRYSQLLYWAQNVEEGFDPTYIEVLQKFRTMKAIYLNPEQKKRKANTVQESSDDESSGNEEQTAMTKVLYKYSKGAMEEFFKDLRLRELFLFFADDIKAQGYTASEKRGKKGPLSKEQQNNMNIQFRKEVDSLASIAEVFIDLPQQDNINTKINIASKGIKKTVKETKRRSSK